MRMKLRRPGRSSQELKRTRRGAGSRGEVTSMVAVRRVVSPRNTSSTFFAMARASSPGSAGSSSAAVAGAPSASGASSRVACGEPAPQHLPVGLGVEAGVDHDLEQHSLHG